MDHENTMMDEGQYEEDYGAEEYENNEEGMMEEDMGDLPVTQEDAWAVIR